LFPPFSFFRRGGLRTRREIEQERYALKALRGDFDGRLRWPGEAPDVRAGDALEAVRT
jgi:hypothetical protein